LYPDPVDIVFCLPLPIKLTPLCEIVLKIPPPIDDKLVLSIKLQCPLVIEENPEVLIMLQYPPEIELSGLGWILSPNIQLECPANIAELQLLIALPYPPPINDAE
jgi:hypothetical protein